jgi:glutamine---fructose-6-phosphate transaminase (isomerizing)
MISCGEALALVNDENKPRYESLRWYLEIVGLNYESVIKKVNGIPKLY